jgi:hypothetical protein
MDESLVQEVRGRARGVCEYCGLPEALHDVPFEVEHIIPRQHGGPTSLSNLAYSRLHCNGLKGSDLTSLDPETGTIVPLVHPRRDEWATHFQLADGRIEPLTPVGRVTVRLLHFNHADRVQERQLLMAAGVLSAPSGSPEQGGEEPRIYSRGNPALPSVPTARTNRRRHRRRLSRRNYRR